MGLLIIKDEIILGVTPFKEIAKQGCIKAFMGHTWERPYVRGSSSSAPCSISDGPLLEGLVKPQIVNPKTPKPPIS